MRFAQCTAKGRANTSMSPLKRILTAAALAAVTVSVYAADAGILSQLAREFGKVAQWRDATTIAFADPAPLAAFGLIAIALGIVRSRR